VRTVAATWLIGTAYRSRSTSTISERRMARVSGRLRAKVTPCPGRLYGLLPHIVRNPALPEAWRQLWSPLTIRDNRRRSVVGLGEGFGIQDVYAERQACEILDGIFGKLKVPENFEEAIRQEHTA